MCQCALCVWCKEQRLELDNSYEEKKKVKKHEPITLLMYQNGKYKKWT